MDKTVHRFIDSITITSVGGFSQEEVTKMFLHLLFTHTGITDFIRFLRNTEVPGRTKIGSVYRDIRTWGYPQKIIVPTPKTISYPIINIMSSHTPDIIDWAVLKKELEATTEEGVLIRSLLDYLIRVFTIKEIINELEAVTQFTQSTALSSLGQICRYQTNGTRQFYIEVKF